jgi:acyl dehydratase
MTSVSQTVEESLNYELGDDDVARDGLLVGIDVASRSKEYFSEPTSEVIRNFAASYGDDNPLFSDPEYAKNTRWSGQIAPPIMSGILNAPLLGDPIDPELKKKTKGLYRGIHAFVSGGTWDFYRPPRPGDTVYSFEGLESVELRPSQFAGQSVFRTTRLVKFNQEADILGVYRILTVYTERRKSKEKGKYSAIEPATYSDEDMAKIDALYEAEVRRGAEPRYWEDVAVGDELPAMVKGPLTVTDIIVFHAGGYGFSPYGLKTGKLNYQNRQRIAPFYIKNAQGVPDVAQRIHWDSQWANAIGNPMAYDYGVLRECWLQHYLTNWMGDHAWIDRQYDEIRRFNFVGDTTYWSGRIVEKRVVDGRCAVHLEIRAANQREEVTVQAEATVVLPSRERGVMVLPQAPDELRRRAAEILERHADLLHERKHSASR